MKTKAKKTKFVALINDEGVFLFPKPKRASVLKEWFAEGGRNLGDFQEMEVTSWPLVVEFPTRYRIL